MRASGHEPFLGGRAGLPAAQRLRTRSPSYLRDLSDRWWARAHLNHLFMPTEPSVEADRLAHLH